MVRNLRTNLSRHSCRGYGKIYKGWRETDYYTHNATTMLKLTNMLSFYNISTSKYFYEGNLHSGNILFNTSTGTFQISEIENYFAGVSSWMRQEGLTLKVPSQRYYKFVVLTLRALGF